MFAAPVMRSVAMYSPGSAGGFAISVINALPPEASAPIAGLAWSQGPSITITVNDADPQKLLNTGTITEPPGGTLTASTVTKRRGTQVVGVRVGLADGVAVNVGGAAVGVAVAVAAATTVVGAGTSVGVARTVPGVAVASIVGDGDEAGVEAVCATVAGYGRLPGSF